MSTEILTLMGYAFLSNVAVSVVPHEPVVIAAGAALGIFSTALVATIGTVLAGVADYRLFASMLIRLSDSAPRGTQRLLEAFGRQPFVVLVAGSLLPLPYWPFKALALASGYPLGRYLAALSLGRFGRYAALAWAGEILAIPGWSMVLIAGLGFVVLAFTRWRGRDPRTETSQSKEQDMTEQKAKRTTQSLTASWEKRNLPRLAAALPSWVTPDQLTGLGIIAAGVIGAGYVLAHQSPAWLALCIVGLVVHWAADSLDGTLARVRKIERERYGYYVDRTADAISTVIIGLCFGLSPYVHLSIAMTMTIGYLLLMLYAEICAYTCREFPLSFGLIGPTEARIVLGLFTIFLAFWTPRTTEIAGLTLTWVDLAVLLVSAVLFATFLASSFGQARRLDKMDRALWNRDALTSSGLNMRINDD